MNGQDIIAIGLAAAAAAYVVFIVRRTLQGRSGCQCASGGECEKKPRATKSNRAIRTVPLVTLQAPPSDSTVLRG